MRNRLRTSRLTGLSVVLLCAGSGVAGAQESSPAEGTVDVSPELSVESFWRSNLYLQEGEVGGGTPTVSGMGLQVRPTLGFKSRSRQLWLDAGVGYTARVMFPKPYEAEAGDLRFDGDGNVVPDLSNLNRFNFFDGNVGVSVAPESTVGVKFSDDASLSGRETEAVNATDAYLMLFRNRAAGAVALRPGTSFEIDVGGEVDTQQYSLPECDKDVGCSNVEDRANLNSRLGWAAVADLSWKFFPKTALIASFDYGAFDWEDNLVNTQGDGLEPGQLGNYLGIPDGKYWHFDGGLRGRFTQKLILGAVLGYTSMTFDEESVADSAGDADGALPSDLNASAAGYGADVSGLTASLEAGVDISEKQRFILSYGKDFQDVFFTNYVAFNRVTARYTARPSKRVNYDLAAMYRREAYEGEVTRNDNFIRASGNLGVAVIDWMDVTGGLAWTRRQSVGGTNPAIEFDDTYISAGLRFHD